MHRDHGIEGTWPVAERLLLAVCSGPGSQRLVRDRADGALLCEPRPRSGMLEKP